MRIGKVKKIIKRPDVIPVNLPPKKKRIAVVNWPIRKTEPAHKP